MVGELAAWWENLLCFMFFRAWNTKMYKVLCFLNLRSLCFLFIQIGTSMVEEETKKKTAPETQKIQIERLPIWTQGMWLEERREKNTQWMTNSPLQGQITSGNTVTIATYLQRRIQFTFILRGLHPLHWGSSQRHWQRPHRIHRSVCHQPCYALLHNANKCKHCEMQTQCANEHISSIQATLQKTIARTRWTTTLQKHSVTGPKAIAPKWSKSNRFNGGLDSLSRWKAMKKQGQSSSPAQ